MSDNLKCIHLPSADSFLTGLYYRPDDSLFLPGIGSKLVLHWTEFRSRTQIKFAVKTNAIIEAKTWPSDPAHLNAISEGIMMYLFFLFDNYSFTDNFWNFMCLFSVMLQWCLRYLENSVLLSWHYSCLKHASLFLFCCSTLLFGLFLYSAITLASFV